MTLLASYRNPKDNTVDWNDLKKSVVDKCALEVRLMLQWFDYCIVQIDIDSTKSKFQQPFSINCNTVNRTYQ